MVNKPLASVLSEIASVPTRMPLLTWILPATGAPSTLPSQGRQLFGDIAPKFGQLTDEVLFGDVWARPELSPRDRSLVTITSLIALYRVNEMPFHLKRALENRVTREEIIAAITHLAFYAGWPPAMTALQIARKVFDEAGV